MGGKLKNVAAPAALSRRGVVPPTASTEIFAAEAAGVDLMPAFVNAFCDLRDWAARERDMRRLPSMAILWCGAVLVVIFPRPVAIGESFRP